VHCPEGTVDRAGVARIARQQRQFGLALQHQVAAFDQELLEQLVHHGLR
jgi:hypothetical protein